MHGKRADYNSIKTPLNYTINEEETILVEMKPQNDIDEENQLTIENLIILLTQHPQIRETADVNLTGARTIRKDKGLYLISIKGKKTCIGF